MDSYHLAKPSSQLGPCVKAEPRITRQPRAGELTAATTFARKSVFDLRKAASKIRSSELVVSFKAPKIRSPR